MTTMTTMTTAETEPTFVSSKSGQEQARAILNSYEAAASLRVLVHMAKSSGPLTPAERAVLEEEWSKLPLPPGLVLKALLEESVDLDKQLALIASETGRERTYNAAYLLAHIGGECSIDQQLLLEHIRKGLQVTDVKATPLGRMYWEAREMVFPLSSGLIADPAERAVKVKESILKFSLFNAVSGAFAIPVATDLVVISTQTIMVRHIGQFWGHTVDRQAARALVGSIAGATGLRIAVDSLLYVVPVLGSVVGATSGFVTTWALGHTADKYFESGGKLEAETLRKVYEEALTEARSAYEKSKDVIEARTRSRKITLEMLEEDLKSGKITLEEYHRKIANMQS